MDTTKSMLTIIQDTNIDKSSKYTYTFTSQNNFYMMEGARIKKMTPEIIDSCNFMQNIANGILVEERKDSNKEETSIYYLNHHLNDNVESQDKSYEIFRTIIFGESVSKIY
ncbi:hypothetical protein GWI33_011907 [Rhynchophorus ferrugineus]|uniref:Uncharacterized protein n=1 Tax=Rhynchophorus ferrugineus TaxID=354439 RepID=A0A834MIV3_RHYFE|nr:hypothetical protein GWI33_011907 [Rhynchophorus ferrugineus]